MAALDTGPCEAWPVLCTNYPEGTSQGIIDEAEMIATEVLWEGTKQQYGLCSMTLRPCRQECFPAWPWIPSTGWYDVSGMSWPYPAPALVGGKWFNIACGLCSSGCSCSSISEVALPYPVANVTEVKVDGVVLPTTAYRVDDWRMLVRLDGQDWPRCNDLNLADTEDGTWSVTAQYGKAVPHLGRMAAGQLATEIVKRCVGAGDCLLPESMVTQISRQGVTKTFLDADAFLKGRTGLYWPDLFLNRKNPSNTGIATIFDIDGEHARRVGT
jgi:hypothetical protein